VRVLVLDNIGKRYGGGAWILRDVGLELPSGQVNALVGGNGSGKSTLLRIVVGVSRPSRGTVRGRPGVVGYVPDRFPPNERMSAMSYLTHLGRVRGLGARAAAARADDLVERLALVGGKDSAIRTLSKGNAQKVALAQALLVHPELLVLDEPWSGLDADAHGVLAEIIAEVAGAGGAVVFTDHRESITRAHASRTYRIESGRLTGTVETTDGLPVVTATVDVVVAPPARGGRPRPVDWRVLSGVVAVSTQRDDVALLVEADHSDQLLSTALDHGWSVRRVGPTPVR
jgi:ABC-type multidrug transport system ATPase subunit